MKGRFSRLPHAGLPALVILLVTGVVLSACSAGPDFRRPDAPGVKTYTPAELPAQTVASPVMGGEAQRFQFGQDIPAEWWSLFHSEALNEVIRQALASSPTLDSAKAALRRAQENLNAQAGATLFPKVDAFLSAGRQKFSPSTFGQSGPGSVFNLYNASVSVSYSLDISGGLRRELEALQAEADYRGFQLQGTYLALTSNIVTAAVKEASLRAQIRAVREILSIQEKELQLVERQFEIGSVSRSDVLAQQTQLAETRATLPPLEKDLALTRHQLAVLSGAAPGEAALPEFKLEGFVLPKDLPVSLPSSLVRQRPDIMASEALLHAASAQVGVATADLYPKVTLTGNYGYESTKLGDLFDSGTNIWSIAAGLTQPIFHGGELNARRRAAIAAYDQAAAVYQETVLLAFQGVADVLRALEFDAAALKAQSDAAEAARRSLELTQRQFELGAVGYISLFNADRQYLRTRINLVQAQAARYSDTAALFHALGGPWWKGADKP
ncbi:MAG: efflux transporter outer membrane subunit [Deltaproteobacteria bacterium]|nr:efflux transporter outer membrane subunit [Deltaproteobacteria bacterium]